VGIGALTLVAAAAAAGVLASRGWPGQDDASGSAAVASAEPPGVYGAPVPDRPEPTAVATDAPRDTPAPSPGTAQAEPAVLITWSGWDDALGGVEVGGYADLVESGGTCTLTLTKGGVTASASRPASADVSTTSCGALSVPGSELSSGTWEAVLTYESPGAAGTSAPVEVEVP